MKYVYLHICPNGKIYVGATGQKKPEYRWANGNGYKNCLEFSKDIKKYGWKNIKHVVYEVETIEEMWYLEKYLIAYYNTTNPEKGYNKSFGGKLTFLDLKHTDDYKTHMSEMYSGVPKTEEVKKKISNTKKEQHIITPGAWKKGHEPWNKGITYSGSPHNEEWRRHQSEGLKGKPKSEVHKQKLRKPRERKKYLTPQGEIREMCPSHVKQWHPDWTRIE